VIQEQRGGCKGVSTCDLKAESRPNVKKQPRRAVLVRSLPAEGRALKNCPGGNFSEGAGLQGRVLGMG